MNRRLFTCLLAVTLGVGACKDGGEAQQDSYFNKSVGQQISMETAQRWVGLYTGTNPAGRIKENAFGVSADNLSRVVRAEESFTGLTFHYGLDPAGETHVFVYPVEAGKIQWRSTTVLDALNNQQVSGDVAKQYVDRYAEQFPDEVWYHFFGGDIFSEILAIEGFETMTIKPALNDVGKPQLLLFVEGTNASKNGRTSLDSDETLPLVYDASYPCPPCPPKLNN